METGTTIAPPDRSETTVRLLDGLYIDGWHHERNMVAGRQVCCNYCHECGSRLRAVLDGELWCPKCRQYR